MSVSRDSLDLLDSATRYPSIPTYHPLDPSNGTLLEEPTQFARFSGPVVLTEKVDGTNARVILFNTGDYVIGSRTELLFARGDRIPNPAQGIVRTLEQVADKLAQSPPEHLAVVYFEVYGGNIGGAAKQYTSDRSMSCRVFDVGHVPSEVLSWPREQIASWRDHGGQYFLPEGNLIGFCRTHELEIVPRIATVDAASVLPTDLLGTQHWLSETLPQSLVALDDNAGKRPEGVVLRSWDRSIIAKARVQNYDRTLRMREQPATAGGRAKNRGK